MSLEAFQQATSDLVASPDLCRLLQRDPESVLSRYQLSTRDQHRLIDLVRQRGMSVNCTLYRFNRITPLYTLLPLTNFVLGESFIHEAELFWETFRDSDPRFTQEVDRFGEFLIERIHRQEIQNEFAVEIIRFELATNELRFSQREEILNELGNGKRSGRGVALQLHPLVRLVEFRHEPAKLLQLLKERRPQPYQLLKDRFWLLLDVLGEELQVRRIDPQLGQILERIASSDFTTLPEEDSEALIEAGMVVWSEANALEP
ncbi:MAG: hypothetical protein ABJA18_02325 [bacterium]